MLTQIFQIFRKRWEVSWDLKVHDCVARALPHIIRLRFRTEGNHKVLDELRAGSLIVANHISIFDPLIISAYTQRTIWWVAAKEFALFETTYQNYARKYVHRYPRFCIKLLAHAAVWIIRHAQIIFVDPGNHMDNRRSVHRIITLLKSGECVALFPQGGIRSNRNSEQYHDVRPAFLSIFRYGQAPVVPVRIERRRIIFFDAIMPSTTEGRRTKNDRQTDVLMKIIKENILN